MLESNVDVRSAPREQAVSNALLHAFLMATRNLCHFLYSHNPRSTDIIAEDFFDDPEGWQRARPDPLPEFADGTFVTRISRRLAHLTWERASGTKPSWGGFRIAWELGKSLEVFVSSADPVRISRELMEDVTVLMRTLRRYIDEFGSVDNVENAPPSMLFDEETFWEQVHSVEPDSDRSR
jgi:hypothetical protein